MMELEGVHGLYSKPMRGRGNSTFNWNKCGSRLNWNRHECRGKRNPASHPPSDMADYGYGIPDRTEG